ncbi:MAG TPA: hypothetical protein VGD73_03600, partial [Pseudonocardia sp.]|uniref:hypothetical protein n=1 Tax=Pseudonocardia sp. TaxID=60912 RepID=UPI002ED79014
MPPALGLVNSELESTTRHRSAATGTLFDTRAVSRERMKAQLQRRPRLFDTVDHALANGVPVVLCRRPFGSVGEHGWRVTGRAGVCSV